VAIVVGLFGLYGLYGLFARMKRIEKWMPNYNALYWIVMASMTD